MKHETMDDYRATGQMRRYLNSGTLLGQHIHAAQKIGVTWERTWRAQPFGIELPNGATFGKSMFDPNSALMKILVFLESIDTTATKAEICEALFDFTYDRKRRTWIRWDDKTKDYHKVNLHGWRSAWFAGLKKTGLVQSGKNGYYLTLLGYDLINMHRDADTL